VAVDLAMPRLSDEMLEGTISRWLKGVGDAVTQGEPVVEVETEKVIVEVEANAAGVITEIVAAEQAVVPVGGLLCRIGAKGEAPAAKAQAAKAPSAKPVPRPPATPAPAPPAAPTHGVTLPSLAPERAARPTGGGDTTRVSPLAQRVATELGIDLGTVTGTGIGGKIVVSDLQPYLGSAPVAGAATGSGGAPRASPPDYRAALASVTGAFTDVPHTALRRTIARRMAESKQWIPHFTMTAEIDVTDLLRERERLNKALPDDKITVNDLLIKAAAFALEQVPELNAAYLEDGVRRFQAVHIGFAVAIDEGLVTPVVRDCHVKSIGRIAREARELAAKAKSRALTAQDLQGGTFTISNLGMFDVVAFSAIINPPQVGILAIAQPQQKPVLHKGRQVVRSRLLATLSADHRAVDGVTVARFLHALKDVLELPEKVLTN
jgi:pyruvate dehydrogenase E2 component (dihydrolipoamide acetyltransferase)